MKSSLRYTERTWGVRSLIAAAVVGAMSLAGFQGTALATPQDDAVAEINYQLGLLGKPLLSGSTQYAKYKDLAKALGNAITSGSAGGPYSSGTENPNLDATHVIALIQVATSGTLGGNNSEVAGLEYIKSVFKAESKLPKLNPTHYPAGALNSGTAVKEAIYAAVSGASMSSGSNWAILAKNASGGKKFAEAIAEELYNRSFFGSPAISDIEAGTTSIVKTDKFFSTDILKVALSSTAATTSGTAGQGAIMRGAYLGDKASVPYLIAAAIASGQSLTNAYNEAVNAIGTNLKLPQAQAAAYTAQQVVSATNAVSAGVAVKNALRTGTAGPGTGYATYSTASKNESFRLVKEIVGAATVAYPDATNHIVAYAVKSGTYVESGKTKYWGVVGGAKAIESGIKYCDLITRAAHSIAITGTTVSGASEAAAAIVEQAVYAAQDSAAALSNKDRNKVISKLVATAVKVAYKTDTDAGKTKKQPNVGALAGAAVGGVVAVTGTATNNAVKKPADPYGADFNSAMLWAITNGALKAVKKDATAFETVTKAIAQAVGYITGFYGGQTVFTNLIAGLKDAAVATNTTVATPATIDAWITAAISAGAAGNPSYGAYGTRDTADGNYYETYWTAMNAPAGTMVTDISGL